MVNKYIILFIALFILIVPAIALPTTTAATSVNSNGAILHSTGAANPMWFMYGQKTGSLSWRTPNSSYDNYTVYGSPILGNTKFYFKACDATGCGSELFFTTSAITPQPTTTFGAALQNITNNPSDIDTLAGNSIASYFWLIPTFPELVWGILFFGIYLGLWIRERDLVVPVILGLLTGSFIMFGDAGLGLGIPPEFQSIAQAMVYASLAGIILTWMKRS
jgi:hypothetical protein